jgi:hypothetical protein
MFLQLFSTLLPLPLHHALPSPAQSRDGPHQAAVRHFDDMNHSSTLFSPFEHHVRSLCLTMTHLPLHQLHSPPPNVQNHCRQLLRRHNHHGAQRRPRAPHGRHTQVLLLSHCCTPLHMCKVAQDTIRLTFICQRESAPGGEQRVLDDAWYHRFSYQRQRGRGSSAAALPVPHCAHAEPGWCHQWQLQMLPFRSLSPSLCFPPFSSQFLYYDQATISTAAG